MSTLSMSTGSAFVANLIRIVYNAFMSVLISAQNLSKSFGSQVLFKEINFSIFQGDRIGLIGPNGAGKSTLFKILMGLDHPDSGSVTKRGNLRVGYASQSPEFEPIPVEEILINSRKIGDFHEKQTEARILLTKVGFKDTSVNAAELSGGWKKRLDIARALMQHPDILLLDEPTNHLDLEGIIWLENFLKKERLTFVVISHDRYFLENASSKIMELNRCYPQGVLVSDGGMSPFMEHREAFLKGQEQQARGLASVVRDEIDWLRRSPKARTTKSQSRVQKAYELMAELAELKQRNKVEKVNIDFTASERETRKLLAGKNLGKSLGGKQLFKGIDITLSPGTRLGIMGTNGTGKTTLLKILAGQLQPDQGTLKYADGLKIVYFDQHREQIPPDISLKQALAPVNDRVNYRGQSIHVNGWAKKFLFSPERLELKVGCLSGGERARINIARLMLEPADLLFLDEPTNDLDIQTLEVIEDSLNEFAGAVVLITHDRCLMDSVCTQIVGLGGGCDGQIFADYAQWEEAFCAPKTIESKPKATENKLSPQKPAISKKLSYNEQRELDQMEKSILEVETLLESLNTQTSSMTDPKESLELYNKIAEAQKKLDTLYERWQFLEHKKSSN